MRNLILILLLASCSANWHLNKAIKKGYHLPVYDTIKISKLDSFPVIIKDSIVWEKYITQKDTVIQIQKEYIPKTRIIERFDLKRFKDSLNHIRSIYSDSLRYALKSKKTTIKTDLKKQRVSKGKTFTDTFKFIAVSLFFLFLIILLFKISRYLGLDNVR